VSDQAQQKAFASAIRSNGGHALELKDGMIGMLMGAAYARVNQSEAYVSVPPALVITDNRGNTWSLGFEYTQPSGRAHYEFNVLKNDVDTGETAERIDYYRGGRVMIYGSYGRKIWNGRAFV
jgi:hypothetical protein